MPPPFAAAAGSLPQPRAIDKEASGGDMCSMKTVGLKVLKNKLSEYVRRAAAGETVIITDRGRPVAELVAPQRNIPTGEGRPLSAFELRGMREGWLRPATIRDDSPPPPGKPIPGYTLEQLLADLDRDREDRV
jgi:prevent-host-death family protein